MSRKARPAPPKDDIPPWFLTYSDVITLLMTFFILLLTFSTTEPEKFDQVERSITNTTAATGLTGVVIRGMKRESWVSRVRPPSARIAMRGAEMPPMMSVPVSESFGLGLQALSPDEATFSEMTSHYFDVDANRLFDSQGDITPQGRQLCKHLASLLQNIPFQASLQFSADEHVPQLAHLMAYLFEVERARPGQVAMTRLQTDQLAPTKLRIHIRRYLTKSP